MKLKVSQSCIDRAVTALDDSYLCDSCPIWQAFKELGYQSSVGLVDFTLSSGGHLYKTTRAMRNFMDDFARFEGKTAPRNFIINIPK